MNINDIKKRFYIFAKQELNSVKQGLCGRDEERFSSPKYSRKATSGPPEIEQFPERWDSCA